MHEFVVVREDLVGYRLSGLNCGTTKTENEDAVLNQVRVVGEVSETSPVQYQASKQIS